MHYCCKVYHGQVQFSTQATSLTKQNLRSIAWRRRNPWSAQWYQTSIRVCVREEGIAILVISEPVKGKNPKMKNLCSLNDSVDENTEESKKGRRHPQQTSPHPSGPRPHQQHWNLRFLCQLLHEPSQCLQHRVQPVNLENIQWQSWQDQTRLALKGTAEEISQCSWWKGVAATRKGHLHIVQLIERSSHHQPGWQLSNYSVSAHNVLSCTISAIWLSCATCPKWERLYKHANDSGFVQWKRPVRIYMFY